MRAFAWAGGFALLLLLPLVAASGAALEGPRLVVPWEPTGFSASVDASHFSLLPPLDAAEVDGGWRLAHHEVGGRVRVSFEQRPDGPPVARLNVNDADRSGTLWLVASVPLKDVGAIPLDFAVDVRTSGSIRGIALVLRENFPEAERAVDTRLFAPSASDWQRLSTSWMRTSDESHRLGVHLRVQVEKGGSGSVWVRDATLVPPLQYDWSADGVSLAAAGPSPGLHLSPGLQTVAVVVSSPLGGAALESSREVLAAERLLTFCHGADGRLHAQGGGSDVQVVANVTVRDNKANARESAIFDVDLAELGAGFVEVPVSRSGVYTARVEVGGERVQVASSTYDRAKATFIQSTTLSAAGSKWSDGVHVEVRTCDPGLASLAVTVAIQDAQERVKLAHVAPGVWEATFFPPAWGLAGPARVLQVEATLENGTAVTVAGAKATVTVGPTERAANMATAGLLAGAFVIASVWTAWEQRRRPPS